MRNWLPSLLQAELGDQAWKKRQLKGWGGSFSESHMSGKEQYGSIRKCLMRYSLIFGVMFVLLDKTQKFPTLWENQFAQQFASYNYTSLPVSRYIACPTPFRGIYSNLSDCEEGVADILRSYRNGSAQHYKQANTPLQQHALNIHVRIFDPGLPLGETSLDQTNLTWASVSQHLRNNTLVMVTYGYTLNSCHVRLFNRPCQMFDTEGHPIARPGSNKSWGDKEACEIDMQKFSYDWGNISEWLDAKAALVTQQPTNTSRRRMPASSGHQPKKADTDSPTNYPTLAPTTSKPTKAASPTKSPTKAPTTAPTPPPTHEDDKRKMITDNMGVSVLSTLGADDFNPVWIEAKPRDDAVRNFLEERYTQVKEMNQAYSGWITTFERIWKSSDYREDYGQSLAQA